MSLPVQAQFMQDTFGGEFVLKTFANGNVDNIWMFKSGDAVLLVNEGRFEIELQLGGSSHAERRTGKIRSKKVSINFSRPSRNVGEINRAKRDALAEVFEGHSDMVKAFIEEFGEDKIREDNR